MLVMVAMMSHVDPLTVAASTAHNVTIIVNSPYVADAQVYVSGTFNNWNPTATPMQPFGYSYSGYSGQWITTIAMTEGQHQFKFTLGSNNTYEKGANFQEIANRVVTVDSIDLTIMETVANYNGLVNIEVTVPSDTHQKGMRVFIAANTKAWFPTSYMMFPKDGSGNVWQTKTLLNSDTTLQYKYNLGTWDKVEKTHNGADIANRIACYDGSTVIKNDNVKEWN